MKLKRKKRKDCTFRDNSELIDKIIYFICSFWILLLMLLTNLTQKEKKINQVSNKTGFILYTSQQPSPKQSHKTRAIIYFFFSTLGVIASIKNKIKTVLVLRNHNICLLICRQKFQCCKTNTVIYYFILRVQILPQCCCCK